MFADLLQKAKGDRSINRFGHEADVDPGYISRLLRCRLETPPSATVLTKIAGSASNNVTIEHLMTAAGYINPHSIIDHDQDRATIAIESRDSGPESAWNNAPERAAYDDPVVDEFLSYCKDMLDRPALLQVFKQIRELSDDKLRRALKIIKMIAEMGD